MFSRTNLLTTAAAIGLGAGLLYFLNPNSGSRRRAEVRDRAVRGARAARAGAGRVVRGARERTRDLVADARLRFAGEPISSERLVQRVQTRMKRVVSHPSVIEVRADEQGTITLSGPVPSSEVHDLLRRVAATPGVHAVNNFVDPMPEPLDSQGAPVERENGARWRALVESEKWALAAPVLVGVAGLALALFGARRIAPARVPLRRLPQRLLRRMDGSRNPIGRGVRHLLVNARH